MQHRPPFPQPIPAPHSVDGTGPPEKEVTRKKVAMQKPGVQDGVFPQHSLKLSSLFRQAPLGYSGWQGIEASTPLWIIVGVPSMPLILQPALGVLKLMDLGRSRGCGGGGGRRGAAVTSPLLTRCPYLFVFGTGPDEVGGLTALEPSRCFAAGDPAWAPLPALLLRTGCGCQEVRRMWGRVGSGLGLGLPEARSVYHSQLGSGPHSCEL